MLESSLQEAQNQLRRRVNSVCRVPEIPMELAEELREVAWSLALHCEHLGYQWSLLEGLREEFVQL